MTIWVVSVFNGRGWVSVERFDNEAAAEAKAAAIGGRVFKSWRSSVTF